MYSYAEFHHTRIYIYISRIIGSDVSISTEFIILGNDAVSEDLGSGGRGRLLQVFQ